MTIKFVCKQDCACEKTKLFHCDRCNKKEYGRHVLNILPPFNWSYFNISNLNSAEVSNSYDICPSCSYSFKDWLEKNAKP